MDDLRASAEFENELRILIREIVGNQAKQYIEAAVRDYLQNGHYNVPSHSHGIAYAGRNHDHGGPMRIGSELDEVHVRLDYLEEHPGINYIIEEVKERLSNIEGVLAEPLLDCEEPKNSVVVEFPYC